MDIIRNQKIGLRIAGTKSRLGGFAPLVAIGILAGDEGDNMDKITLITEKPVYIIKHTNDYILYQLIDRKVKPYDRDTIGILSIALTIARDAQLADGKSPYSLLKEVYKKFVEDYMECGSDGLDSFVNKDIDQSVFASISEKYPLESRSPMSAYIPMNPVGMSGTLCVPQDKMDDLFRDSQYPEFAQFKEVEIGLSCMTMPGLENIEIPRPQIYSVFVNGKDVRYLMSKATDMFDTAKYLESTKDVEYENISFSLSDLFKSDNRIKKGGSVVELDTVNNRIMCNIGSKKNMYTLAITCEGEGATYEDKLFISKKIKNQSIKIIIKGNTINDKKEVPVSFGTEKVEISPNRIPDFGNLVVESTVDDCNQQLKVTVYIKERTINEAVSTSNNGYYNKRDTTKNQHRSEEVNPRNEIQKNSNPDVNIDNNIDTRKKKRDKRLLFLLVGFVLVCIGFGSWGVYSISIGGKVTQEDSIQMKKQEEIHRDLERLDSSVRTAMNNIMSVAEQVKKNVEETTYTKKLETKESVEAAKKSVEALKKVAEKAYEAIADAEKAMKQKKEVEDAIKKTKVEILAFVNQKNLQACRNHPGWNGHLTKEERYAVEAVLNMGQYKGAKKKSVEILLKSKHSFNNWDELMKTRGEIEKISENK